MTCMTIGSSVEPLRQRVQVSSNPIMNTCNMPNQLY